MPCYDHQKPWRTLCVDRGFRDEWLEAMNSLHGWTVYSTCEGHAQAPPQGAGHSDHPRIWFHASTAVDAELIWRWHIIEEVLRREAFRLLYPDITAIELWKDFDLRTERQSVFLHLEYRLRRRSTDMEPDTVGWFERLIAGLVEFDRVTRRLLERELAGTDLKG